ncbi:hypothetical protein ACWDAS_31115, partial [Streptomyces sp. NPDC001070]
TGSRSLASMSAPSSRTPLRVCFVCTGNICRSPGGRSHAGAPLSLPAMTFGTHPDPAADGRAGGTVGLTALVSALATACHRVRLRAGRNDQPCAFSYASRICAGTRPRSLTS